MLARFLSVLLLFLSSMLWASTERLVTVVTLPEYEPFCFYKPGVSADIDGSRELIRPGDNSRMFDGLAWQVVLEAFQQQGYTVVLSVAPWKRAMSMLDNGDADLIFPAVKTEARLLKYHFSEHLVYPENRFLFYVQTGSSQQGSGLKDMFDRRIGYMRGFSYGDNWLNYKQHPRIKTEQFNSLKQGFRMLSGDRFDAVVGYELSHDYYLQKWQWRDDFRKLPAFGAARSYLMGLQSAELTGQLLTDFDLGIAEMISVGRYQQLVDKWINRAGEMQ